MDQVGTEQEVQAKPGQTQSIVGFVLSVATIIPSFMFLGIPSIIALVVSSIGYRKSRKGGGRNKMGIAGIVIAVVTLIAVAVLYSIIVSQYLSLCRDLLGRDSLGECLDFYMHGTINP